MSLGASFTAQLVAKAMDGLALRHQAMASNVANVETPLYKRRSVNFEDQLRQALNSHQQERDDKQSSEANNSEPLAMQALSPLHLQGEGTGGTLQTFRPNLTQDEDNQYRNDGSSVDIEAEMARLAQNTQRFNTLSTLQARYFRGLHQVIQSGNS